MWYFSYISQLLLVSLLYPTEIELTDSSYSIIVINCIHFPRRDSINIFIRSNYIHTFCIDIFNGWKRWKFSPITISIYIYTWSKESQRTKYISEVHMNISTYRTKTTTNCIFFKFMTWLIPQVFTTIFPFFSSLPQANPSHYVSTTIPTF